MNKILFLDIDGVLKSFDNMYSMTYLWNIDKNYKCKDEFGDLFDDRCVNWLRFVCLKTNCKIVISSTWGDNGVLEMQRLWQTRNLPGEIIDVTPKIIRQCTLDKFDDIQADRGFEIQEYIELNNITKYCIVDDYTDMLTVQLPYFVNTNKQFGLTKYDAIKIIDILN